MGSNVAQRRFVVKILLPSALFSLLLPLAIFTGLYFYHLRQLNIPQRPPSEYVSSPRRNIPCNYTVGRWVPDKSGPRYNGSSCATIKDGQNCMAHGRPDTGYLYWRWRPMQCELPRFQPSIFLHLLRNKHLAFVGDSMARNQLESLLCLISSTGADDPPYNLTLVYTDEESKFRRWRVESHNVTISIYWSPFLVKGVEKLSASATSASGGAYNYNKLYLSMADERWASEVQQMDLIVFSAGHWFLHPAIYYERNDELEVFGCHYCPGTNFTETGFFEVFRRAIRRALQEVVTKWESAAAGDYISSNRRHRRQVVVTTFSPSHFEGEWDKAGACPKTEPYKEGEKKMEWMDEEMRKIGKEEVEKASHLIILGKEKQPVIRVEALDITEMAMMRADGHPGPYMNPNPFHWEAQGGRRREDEKVQNDCLHWCMPGPIDIWNEIFLQLVKDSNLLPYYYY